jgi:PAS domain-containing protein
MAGQQDTHADTETDLRHARDLLQDAIESLSEGFALYDDDRCLVMCNERYRQMNSAVADMLVPGLNWEILMREGARRGVYADAIGREDEWVQDRLKSTHDYVDEYELEHTDGSVYLVSTHPTKLGGFVVTRTDITERRKAELADRDGDLLIRTVLDASAAVVIMARTGDGQILYRSPAALEMFGNTKSAREHYVNIDERADFVTQMLSDGQVDNYRLNIKAKGVILPASISARFAEYRGEEVIVTSVIDLTQ